MLVNLIDIKHTGKFCKTFISKIFKWIVNFNLVLSRNRGKWGLQNFIQTTQLVMQYRLGYPISVKKLPLGYPKCLLRKRESSKNYLKGCDSLLLHKSNHIHLYELLCYQLTKFHYLIIKET